MTASLGGPLLDPYGNPRDVGGPPGLYRVLLLHNAHDESLQTIAVLAHGTSGKFEVVHAEWNPNTKRAALACIPKLSEVTGRQKAQGEQAGMKAASNESPREPEPKTGQKAGRVTLGLQALRGLMASKLGLQALDGLVAGNVGLDALRRLNPGKVGLQALRGIGAIAGSATMRFGSLLEAYHALGESFISRLKLSSDFGAADTGAASYGAFDGEGYIRVGGFYRQVFERPDNATHGGLDEMNRRLRKVKGKVLTRAQLYHLALHQDGDKHMGVEAYNEYLREERRGVPHKEAFERYRRGNLILIQYLHRGKGVRKMKALRQYWDEIVKIYPTLHRYRDDFLKYGRQHDLVGRHGACANTGFDQGEHNPWELRKGTRRRFRVPRAM
ncbi:hypothetical protein DCS_03407 [Drechmeria coniospora]|uniref:Uncharacterized protein n=1 Tax=Drechmeria coniospora TaxID=98403 RepID=A0A151GH23_DRECN|nr:hypothetical protein DCS_03407 [Drechmeria coniospora]KYK56407.1 hypothetical protein DCS_03407 [Drechmeria coniospora]